MNPFCVDAVLAECYPVDFFGRVHQATSPISGEHKRSAARSAANSRRILFSACWIRIAASLAVFYPHHYRAFVLFSLSSRFRYPVYHPTDLLLSPRHSLLRSVH